MRMTRICLAFLLVCGCDRSADTTANQSAAEARAPEFGERWRYPREREVNGRRVIVHAPQIRSWDDFERFTAQGAVEFLEKKMRLGASVSSNCPAILSWISKTGSSRCQSRRSIA